VIQQRAEFNFAPLDVGASQLWNAPDGWHEHRIRVEVSFLCAAAPLGPGNLVLNAIRWARQSGIATIANDPSESAPLVSTAKAAADFAAGVRSTGSYDSSGFDSLQLVNGLGVQLLNVRIVARVLPTPVEQVS
jgi:hypothetical protein